MGRARKWARAEPAARTGRGRRRYSDEEKSDALVALQANGGNLKRTARELGVPIVPVTTAGAYEHHRVGDWNLYPGPVVVHVHDTIPVERIKDMDTAALMEHVRRVIEGPQRG